jgi:type III secretion protein N (ATPase)
LLARYQEMELMIRLGEYKPGVDPVADRAVDMRDAQMAFLRQNTSTSSDFKEAIDTLIAMQE